MFKNMKIRKKLLIAFISISIIASISGAVGLTLIMQLDRSYSKALVENGLVQSDVGNFNTYLNQSAALIRDVIILTNPAEIQAAQTNLDRTSTLAKTILVDLEKNCQSPEEVAVLNRISTAIQKFEPATVQVIALGVENKNDEALEMFSNTVSPYLNECVIAAQELTTLKSKMGDQLSASLTKTAQTGVMSMVAISCINFLIALYLAYLISKGISKPVAEIEHAAVMMSECDYNVTINHHSGDEIGSLADSMRKMMSTTKEVIADTSRGLYEISNSNFDISPRVAYVGVFKGIETAMIKIIMGLSQTLSQIRVSAEQVSSGSEQVSCGAQVLAQGATEQASTVQQLSASIHEVSDQIQSNANNAKNASELAVLASMGLGSSNDKMLQLTQAISEINDSSSQIGKIIKTIEDIAFQTNILALNAAVEAARAGEAGKGFAVVADEVRNLANKSSQAAKQTNALIERSVNSVQHGVKITDETAKSLTDVVKQSKMVTELITKISEASSNQAGAMIQINLGLEQISSVIQTNSATSEQSAAASEQLNSQAHTMKQLISTFQLKEQGFPTHLEGEYVGSKVSYLN